MEKVRVLDYFLVGILLVLSTFEYFFRADILCNCFLALCIICALIKGVRLNLIPTILIFSIFLVLVCQSLVDNNRPMVRAIYLTTSIFGIYCLSWLVKSDFIRIITNIIVFIAGYSIIIYLLSLVPFINDFLVNELTPKFPSLNVQNAVMEGGGKNIIIYNFLVNYVSDAIGFRRNCGPFWEPGMFAVFLNLALFFNMVILNGGLKKNILLIVSLVSTFSTGGYITMIFILGGYFILRNKSKYGFFALIIIFFTAYQLMDMEFIGLKLFDQMNNHRIGDDSSRFGAFYTQLQMISDNFFIGGAEISAYASETKTLASGVLMPIVDYGIFLGLFIYICYYISCINLTHYVSLIKLPGLFLFCVIMLMSFSQTILESPIYLTLMFVGLIKNVLVHDKN